MAKKITIVLIFLLVLVPVLVGVGVFWFLSLGNNLEQNSAEPVPLQNSQQDSNDFENKEDKINNENNDFLLESKIPDIELPEPDSEQDNFTPPDTVKAVYLTGWSAGNKDMIDYLIWLAHDTEINAVVIDIKDYSGFVSYDSKIEEVIDYKAKQIKIYGIESLIKKLHKYNIYVIARLTVFQDPIFALNRPEQAVQSQKLLFCSSSSASALTLPDTQIIECSTGSNGLILWKDRKELYWVDPASEEAWDYNISIAREAVNIGFDEINFDYIRFPSDGDIQDMFFPVYDEKTERHLIIKEFFEYLRQELPGAKLSADLFGLSTIRNDDLGIGQIIEDAYLYFDYVCPMVYPSHYASGFIGYKNPAEYPYEVISYSLVAALERLKKGDYKAELRPWLQDFDMGADYDAEMVRAEIEAVNDVLSSDSPSYFSGYMLWSPYNIYTKKALEVMNSEQ